ncbi:unnamed protein product [Menidia menidia]|uniref:(Atlantic silverside) hypothetical protein n=1 Tax=Menidia menidia TaxID=238744 RepID=A0A8S4AAN3_9TELE|nr:unnamed protein product [Menidia menidia]
MALWQQSSNQSRLDRGAEKRFTPVALMKAVPQAGVRAQPGGAYKGALTDAQRRLERLGSCLPSKLTATHQSSAAHTEKPDIGFDQGPSLHRLPEICSG